MSFVPVLPSGGLVGWQFLQRTYDVQMENFTASQRLQRDVAYFEENIASITSAEALVSDRQLLNVALGAFGLQDDLSNTYFIQRILGDGTTSDDALANRLADDRYSDFSKAFGFGPGDFPKTSSTALMGNIVEKFQFRQFEQAVGEQDDTMRIALYAQRELADLAAGSESESTKWFTIMGQPPLRTLFETALGLPSSFGQIDIDKQQEIFRDRARSVLGADTVGQFTDSASLDKLITTYQARAQIDGFAASSGASTALTLLQLSQA